ncbi:MAG: type II secretion system F family protein [archaeon]
MEKETTGIKTIKELKKIVKEINKIKKQLAGKAKALRKNFFKTGKNRKTRIKETTESKTENTSKIELIFGKERIKNFSETLEENNSGKKAEELIKLYLAFGAATAVISVAVSFIAGLDLIYSGILFALSFFLPGLLHYFFHLFKFEKNKREKENLVPDILLQASIFPKGTPIIKIIKYISESDYGLMSKEFNKAFSETEKGKTIEDSLKDISLRCKSEIISRTMNLLIQGNRSGAEMNKVFKETAEDILETQSIIKERIASTFIQKYTLILAGGIIVPALLGLIVGFINEMSFLGINELGLGMPAEQRKEIIEAALTANQIYLIEYALIASVFIAQQEGNTKKALVYALILIPLGVVCYNLALLL